MFTFLRLDRSTGLLPRDIHACTGMRRARSRACPKKLAIVDEEADESEFWCRIIRKSGLKTAAVVNVLEQEAHELAYIFSASLRTARANATKRREGKRKKSTNLG